MLILLTVTLALWAVGFLLVGRLRSSSPPASSPPPDSIDLTVIIPARNEEHNLPRLLRSLGQQSTRPRQVLVVDDGSTDRTAQVAAELGATVLPSQPLPDGWRGKTWACHQGAQSATSHRLLFLDADTWLEPEGLPRALAAHTTGAFSAGPYHVVQQPYEQLSLFFNLNMIVGTVPDRLFGPMLLIDRDTYQGLGGHAAVRNRILENLHLAREAQQAGIPVRSIPGRGMLCFRMYPQGLRELIDGWAKGFASGAGQTPPAVLALVVAWMTGLALAPLGWLMSADSNTWAPVYALCALQVGWFSRHIGNFHPMTALLYPLPLAFFFGLFTWAVTRSGRKVQWKGRQIRAE
jgi:4,4'-diaponeurosporenoate glycosyltransferase